MRLAFVTMVAIVLSLVGYNIAQAPEKPIERPIYTVQVSDKQLPSRSAIRRDYVVTAYTAGFESTGKHPGDSGFGITASGTKVEQGKTCACPPSLPLGTIIHIEGVGWRVCEDRGGDIQEGRIDVYFDSLTDAIKFGRKKLQVTGG